MHGRHVVALLAAGGLLGLTGCGDNASSTGADAQSGSETSAVIEKAQAVVDAATKVTGVEFDMPTTAFDPGAKKVAIISCGQTGEGCLNGAKFATEAAEAIGWEPSATFDGQFNPSKQAGFVQQAVRDHYDAIVLVSIDASSIKAAVEEAAEANIPIACVLCVTNPDLADAVMDSVQDTYQEGVDIASYQIVESQGQAKVLGFEDKAFPAVTQRFQGISDTLKDCGSCTYEQIEIPTSDLSKPGPPTWTGALSANPRGSFDWAATPYDYFAIPFAKTALESGRDEVTITGFDGWSEMAKEVSQGTLPVRATTGIPVEFMAWAGIDLVARASAGVPVWEANKQPARLVTEDNADQFVDGFFQPDFDFKADFESLWTKG
jgi:ribose transport system substrate-binding protein